MSPLDRTPIEPIRLRIEGMTSGSCAESVESALRAVPGVNQAWVNLTAEIATIDVADAAPLRKRLAAAVRRAGYDVDTFREGDASLSGLERTCEARFREQRQAFAQAVGIGLPIIALHWLAPTLQSTDTGGQTWPLAIQALLCAALLSSSAGAPLLVGGLRALFNRVANSNLLIMLGVVVAFVAGVIGLIAGTGNTPHFYTAAVILTVINLGRLLELRARREACCAASALVRRMPRTARLVSNGESTSVHIGRIAIADHVEIAPNTMVPVDGRIVEGEGTLDENVLTGESRPRFLTTGDEVLAGTLLVDGTLTIEATRVGHDSAIDRIIHVVERAQTGKSPMQRLADRHSRLADRVTGVFVPLVILCAVATLLGAHFAQSVDWSTAATRAVAVLIVACPTAIGLAAPAVELVAVSTAALQGILVRDVATLETARRITFVSPSDVTINTTDVMIVRNDLRPKSAVKVEGSKVARFRRFDVSTFPPAVHSSLRLDTVVSLGRRSMRIIKQNLVGAVAYNLIAVPLAAAGKIPPGYAAAAMMLCTIGVVLSALRLRQEQEPDVHDLRQ